ncbi:TRAP transporter large permease [Propylenella binzhouense]|uniref:TRAP transporter large permease protein n=1 Tax=Propylenella binzhouense TaxID=2555902 RepID=A0A964WUW5_9HYPH|nr:TRAP transporter large permease [Propylenella binzhouense]MYZ49567.1 TRAP transporter large permease [Propylenella binzhouense]
MLLKTTLALFVLLAMALPIAAVLGVLALFIDIGLSRYPLNVALGDIAWQHSTDFTLVAVPLFILMGEIMLHAGISTRMYAGVARWLSWLPGGLMHANIGACAIFAATSGSSVATAATIGVAAMPEIDRRGYNERLFLGSLAAGGTLGILIPPSMNMIIYGLLTSTSVPRLFIAGILPGIILTLFYMGVVLICCLVRPDWAGQKEESTWAARFAALRDLLQPTILFLLVLGSIYAGWATPTEAAALGVIGALALAALNGQVSAGMLRTVLENTVRVSAMLTLILIFALFLNFAIAAVGMVRYFNDVILGLGWPPLATLLFIISIYILLGTFMDGLAMVVLTVPVVAPIVVSLGYDPVWFGVMIVLICEAAILSPPVGMALFVLQGIRGRGTVSDIFWGVTPFMFAIFALIALIIAYPAIVLWLPGELN